MNRRELDARIYEEIKNFCADGDRLAEAKQYESAIGRYNSALRLVPEPRNEWNATTWILAAIADAAFLGGYLGTALEAVEYAMTCPNAVGNPFLHLRYGQVLFEKGELDAAAEELMRAYIGGREKIFSTDDPKYLKFLSTRAKL